MSRLRVLIADAHRLCAEGLRALLADKFEVAGLTRDGVALVRTAAELKPDVIVLDTSLPKLSGIEAAQIIHRKHPEIKLLFLTVDADPDQIRAARRAGASGYLLKSIGSEELISVINEITSADRRKPGRLKKPVTGQFPTFGEQADAGPAALTPRQREVLQLTTEGLSAREIGELLSISKKTVEFHKSELRKVLRISSTAELVRYALKHQIVA